MPTKRDFHGNNASHALSNQIVAREHTDDTAVY
jgi:hypothetical protein